MRRLSIISDHLLGKREIPEISTNNISAQDKKKEEINEFLQTYETIVDDLIKELSSKYEQPTYAIDWIKKLLDYTIVGGKLNRGLTAIHTLEILKGRPLNKDEKFKSGVLGWAVEWMQTFFLISDDIMDSSITRRGKECYYRSQHPLGEKGIKVGLTAINDSFIVKSHIYRMLYFYFRHESYYSDLIDLYNETIYQTELGQLLDLTSQPPGRLDFDLYTLERYLKIVTYKTAFYSFYLPVVASVLIHYGKFDKEKFDEAKSILIPMGQFFQIQDDYLDCYGTPEVIGKVGRDIEEAKCGWLVVQALKRVNNSQLELLKANYGKDDPKSVSIVKKIYNEINLSQVYHDYEESSYQELVKQINGAKHLPKDVYLKLLQKIYKRSI